MRTALLAVVLSLPALLLPACGAAATAERSDVPPVTRSSPDAPAPARAPAALDVEAVLLGVPVTKTLARLRDLAPGDLAEIVTKALAAHPGGRIHSLLQHEPFHASGHLVRVAFESHEVGERIRRYHTLEFSEVKRPAGKDPQASGPGWEQVGGLEVNLEVCPPWRSFRGGLPPLDDELVDLWFVPDVSEAALLGIVDAVRPHIPEGHRLWSIQAGSEFLLELDEGAGRPRRPGDDVYEVETVRGCGGVGFRVENAEGRWSVGEVWEWIS